MQLQYYQQLAMAKGPNWLNGNHDSSAKADPCKWYIQMTGANRIHPWAAQVCGLWTWPVHSQPGLALQL
jgi:hypothetical protein